MVRVLVTGVNGLIGGATALALRRAGHIVYGLIRDPKQSATLLENEIIPVIGDSADVKSFSAILDKVSVVIDNVLTYEQNMGQSNRSLLSALAASSTKQKYKKRYIYTSGVLVYNYPEVVDETFTPNGLGLWRIELEQTVITQPDVEGVVLRPGWVYGGSGGYVADIWYKGSQNGEVEYFGNVDKSWGWVHVTDLADAYLRAVEANGRIVGGEIFDVVDSTRVTCLQARTAFAKAAGLTGPVVLKEAGKDNWSQTMEANAVPKADKIRRQLSWSPKNGPLLDGLDIYYQSWKAHQDKKKVEKKEEKPAQEAKEAEKVVELPKGSPQGGPKPAPKAPKSPKLDAQKKKSKK